MTTRPDIIEAIINAFRTDDPMAYPLDVTPEERAAAEEQIAAALAAQGPRPDPSMQARRILYRAYQPGDDWDDLFDRLTTAEIDTLRELLPHLPQRAGPHFVMRFVAPGGHNPANTTPQPRTDAQ